MRDFEALQAYLASRADTAFTWGKRRNDCGSFAIGALEAVTGLKVARRFPQWSTERGARRMLKRRGGYEAVLGTVLTPIAPAMAQRGDIAGVIEPGGELFLMVVEGDTLVGPGASGARRLRRSRMVKAWSAA